MADYLFSADTKVDGVSTGLYSSYEASPDYSVIREILFGPLYGGSGPNHFDIRNILVGTTGFGSSDLFAPTLSNMADFDAFYGSGSDPTFSGGIMSFNNTGDRYGVKDLGADYTDIYVQFDIRIYPDDVDPDYTDIGLYSGAGAAQDIWTGIYAHIGDIWQFDGDPDTDGFGAGPVKDGTTWTTISIHWFWGPVVAPTITSFTPTSGYYGDSITITGTGFLGATDLQFNGVSSSVYWNYNSDTEIIAYIPSDATTGPITIVNSAGSGTSSEDFTVSIPPVPTITSFTPHRGVAGSFSSYVTIIGTGFTYVSTVEFNGVESDFVTIISDTEIHVYVPAGATTGPITIISPGGSVTSDDDFMMYPPALIVFDGQKSFEIAT